MNIILDDGDVSITDFDLRNTGAVPEHCFRVHGFTDAVLALVPRAVWPKNTNEEVDGDYIVVDLPKILMRTVLMEYMKK